MACNVLLKLEMYTSSIAYPPDKITIQQKLLQHTSSLMDLQQKCFQEQSGCFTNQVFLYNHIGSMHYLIGTLFIQCITKRFYSHFRSGLCMCLRIIIYSGGKKLHAKARDNQCADLYTGLTDTGG